MYESAGSLVKLELTGEAACFLFSFPKFLRAGIGGPAFPAAALSGGESGSGREAQKP